jgi:hypothetical protein
MGIDEDYTIEAIRAATTDKLYEILASCGQPGYYQMAVEELQRRYLEDISSQTRSLTASSQRLETVTMSMQSSVTDVGLSVRRLADSSDTLERLTKWLMWLTVALLVLTLFQVGLIVKDQFSPKRASSVQPAVEHGNRK